MTWKPDLSTREEVSGFVSDLLAVLPDQLGIDEVIAGCEVLVLPAGAPPKYLDVALGGDAGPPQTGYTQAVLYRGGITGLAVGDYVTVIHLREGNRYEVLGPGGAAGAVPDPAPIDAQYVTMALDATLTDERVLTAGDWLSLTDGGAGGLATLDFEPDLPVVVSAGGVLTEYATIQAAITAAAACETVLVPPGTYAEDITLKNGVCVKGFGPRDKIRITGDVSIVTTASGGWLENVTVVMTDPPNADANSAVHEVHNGICHVRQITIIGTQSAARAIRGIGGTGAGTGTLIADDIIIDISSAGNQAAYGVHLNLGSYELEMKNFKIVVDNSNGGAAAWALGIVQAGSTAIKATEGWLDVTATGAGTATDISGTVTYSEIVNTSDYTLFGQRVGVNLLTDPSTPLHIRGVGRFGRVADDNRYWDIDATSGTIRHYSGAVVETQISYTGGNSWFGATAGVAGAGAFLFLDGAAREVGVGTVTPGNDFNVSGTAINGTIGMLLDTTGAPTGIGMAGGEGPPFIIGFSGGAASYNYAGNMLGRMAFQGQANDFSYLGARIESYVEVGGNIVRANHVAGLDFYTKPTGNPSPTRKVRILGNGYTGINATPSYRLDVHEDRATSYVAKFFNDGDNVNRYGIIVQCGADNGAAAGQTEYFAALDGNGGWTGSLRTINGVFQLVDLSDERHKTDIRDTGILGLDIINGLRVRDCNWKACPEGPAMTSFVAQEAQKVYPDMVGVFGDGALGISRGMLIPVLVKAIQEQQIQIERLRQRLEISHDHTR